MFAKLVRQLGNWLDRRTRLMPAMFARLGIDAEGGDVTDAGLAMWEAGQSCVLCGSVGRCERWLADGGDTYGYRAFCPNAGIFDRLPRRR